MTRSNKDLRAEIVKLRGLARVAALKAREQHTALRLAAKSAREQHTVIDKLTALLLRIELLAAKRVGPEVADERTAAEVVTGNPAGTVPPPDANGSPEPAVPYPLTVDRGDDP